MRRKLVFLKTSQDFSKLRFPGPSYSSPFLRIRVGRSHQNNPRFGFIVPKKTISRVVDRNLIKRRLKSIIAQSLEYFRPVDILIFPSQQAVKIQFRQLEEQALRLFKKAGIWKQ
ncbi:MAG: ribonuclease P protein component [Candidatus Doudnabacteria bacterium]|nr:ribonuclease P protein component [Candidatus Doudnabacteria bacterium]